MLKHHADLPGTDVAELRFRKTQHVLAEQSYGAGGRLDQPVDVAHQGRLAAPRQAHDAEDFAASDVEGNVRDTDDGVETLEDVRFAEAVATNLIHDFFGAVAEDLPDAFENDCGRVHGVLRSPSGEIRCAGPGRPRRRVARTTTPGRGWPGRGVGKQCGPGKRRGTLPPDGLWSRAASAGGKAPPGLSSIPLRIEPQSQLSTRSAFSSTHFMANSAGSCFSTVMANTIELTCAASTWRLLRI